MQQDISELEQNYQDNLKVYFVLMMWYDASDHIKRKKSLQKITSAKLLTTIKYTIKLDGNLEEDVKGVDGH